MIIKWQHLFVIPKRNTNILLIKTIFFMYFREFFNRHASLIAIRNYLYQLSLNTLLYHMKIKPKYA